MVATKVSIILVITKAASQQTDRLYTHAHTHTHTQIHSTNYYAPH